LRAIGGVPTNLPLELTSFVGRGPERATVAELIAAHRLVTLTGSGGCGKTRLALRVANDIAENFADGVCWVDLARLSDESLLPDALASALAIKEAPRQRMLETLKNHLRDKHLLLVLDNCEHVVDACAELVHELLLASPSISILTTSREPIGVEGEVSWRVPSLQLPEKEAAPDVASLLRCEAVQLFVDRARGVRPDFELTGDAAAAVAEICERLDGIPLAIELAAARARMMTPGQIAAGLADRFRLLTGSTRTAVPRHQTLRASVDWSYKLLANEERIVLARLGVFPGGFTLEAAEEVCSRDGIARDAVLDIVARLVDRSLVQMSEEASAARYRLLETIRQYALDRLVESGEAEAVRQRHLHFFVALAERAQPEIEGSRLLEWLSVFEVDLDNVRAAFDWSVQSKAANEGLRLMSALWMFWMVRGHLTEGRRRFEIALAAAEADPRLRGSALIGVAMLTSYYGDYVATGACAREALDIAWATHDEQLEGRALDQLGYSVAFLDPPSAPRIFEDAATLLRKAGDGLFIADALNGLGIVRYFLGDYAGGSAVLEEAVECSRGTGNVNVLTISLGMLGYTLALQGRLARARTCLREALALSRRQRDRVWTSQALYGLAFIEAHRGEYDDADAKVDESVGIARDVSPMILAWALLTQGLAGYMRGNVEGAAVALEETLVLSRDMVVPWLRAWSLAILGNIARNRGDLDGARARVDEALAVARSGGARIDVVLDADARLARATEDLERAESLHHEAMTAARAAESVLVVPAQLEAVAGLATVAESFSEAARLFGAAEAARDAYSLVRYAVDEAEYQAHVERVRSELTDDSFKTAWEQGRAMSLDEAVAYASRGRGERRRPSSGWASLTPTELEVVRHVAAGRTNPQIAERLFVSRSTVKMHLAHIFTKLGVSTRAELAAAATRRGL